MLSASRCIVGGRNCLEKRYLIWAADRNHTFAAPVDGIKSGKAKAAWSLDLTWIESNQSNFPTNSKQQPWGLQATTFSS